VHGLNVSETAPVAPLKSLAPSPAGISWDGLIEKLPIGIATCDRDGRILRANPALSALTHYSADELTRRTLEEIALPEDVELDRTLYERQVKGDLPSYSIAMRLVVKDGGALWVSVNSSAVNDRAGRFLHSVRVFQDIHRQKETEERLRDSERRLRELLEALPVALYTTDTEGRITFYNHAAADFWGRRPELNDERFCGAWQIYYPDGRPMPHEETPMAATLKEARPVYGGEAIAERPDGTRTPFRAYPTPLHDSEGKMVGAVNMLVDLSDRKALVDELNHRVKNTLATVQAIAAQTMRNENAREMREAFTARLMALNKAHDVLALDSWREADLKSIIREVLNPFQSGGHERIQFSGNSLKVNPTMALTMSMVLHEMAGNAARFGALSAAGGRLAVSWDVDKGLRGQTLYLVWVETGGPKVSSPGERGFGTRLLERGIVQQLHGMAVVDFEPTGLRCRMEIPLSTLE
jgi:PAS domain S-box-containing protein